MLLRLFIIPSKVERMQVQKSRPSCIYVALAGPKSAVGHFPQIEGQSIGDHLCSLLHNCYIKTIVNT